MFGVASGLRVNLAKSSTMPIRCSQENMSTVTNILGCPSGSLPCKYLGLPLSIKKQTTAQFAYIVEQLATCLPTWKAASLPKSGRLLLIQTVLCAIPIHAMFALNIPPKTLAALNKICRGFLWCGKVQANGGNCAVPWNSVCAPKWAGGLGIPNLGWLNVAMQARWQ